MEESAIWWVRRDLRLADNPALQEALASGLPVRAVFLWAPEEEGEAAPGAAARWWLHHSLAALARELRRRGGELECFDLSAKGVGCAEALRAIAEESRAGVVTACRRVEPSSVAIEERVQEALRKEGVRVVWTVGGGLIPHDGVRQASGGVFQRFTPFWRSALSKGWVQEAVEARWLRSAPFSIPAPLPLKTVRVKRGDREVAIGPVSLEELGLLPKGRWAEGWLDRWQPGEEGGVRRWHRFLTEGVRRYHQDRDRLDREGTSRLSPHLHFGEVAAARLVADLVEAGLWGEEKRDEGGRAFVRALGWREFAYGLLRHVPRMVSEPLREEFRNFPWLEGRADWIRAWQRGETGIPLVDAAMRGLWQTGWMPNRARMVVASFLTKNLGVDWRVGAAWFWETLVDADLANNAFGWQWAAGCGGDGAPYFRVFNPVLQGRTFDPEGAFVRAFVPELRALPREVIHDPERIGPLVRREVGYREPVVEVATSRAAALARWKRFREQIRGTK
ncbi:MAG: DNA photolyase family protein [Hydrogenophilus sp.]|nr:DNA photolyase family protein [Hydrogenophilus sp.]